ncbi:TIGR04063 family PEP-CTERM/XrtA system glycosyltransferase [Sphingobium algorifonticola]|uniref:Glycosyltransferase, exosortase A system-associated n=1 Tax=Sphingobium algorifonticola TaxID=2008318 RepID=A0A437J5R2_9SPHN|nr:TIGR04063 family PEP-CTERM/XrtA system glycosyltransferase [Sphingobium algorifonticola]RVT40134.1 glycosyltransferase, exosortase A system-associated [Sphingobium algorifonticola]
MTRILHVLDHSLPMHSGYSFRTRAILRAQMTQGWMVRGVTGRRHSADGPPVETVDGLTFHRTAGDIAPGQGLIREWREVAALAEATDAVVRDWQPHLIHAHSPVLNALAAGRVARRHGLPFVYEIRAFWEDAAVGNGTGSEGSPKYWLTRQLESHAVRAADAVIVICEGLKDDLVGRGIPAEKITIAPNGVDMEMFGAPVPPDPALRSALRLDDAEVVGFIGSFYDYEGLDDLIAAMPMLVARRPAAKLLLVGGGPCENALRQQAAASPVAQHICFVGRVPHHAVENYYSLIDVLAYPRKAMRLTELVTPLKPLEAMAQGRLVAASSVGGHRELISDGLTGTLFPPDDPQAIAAALARLFADRSHWDARRAVARRFVEQERNWAANVMRYEPVYQRLLIDYRVERAA